jgi:hypothetical protein
VLRTEHVTVACSIRGVLEPVWWLTVEDGVPLLCSIPECGFCESGKKGTKVVPTSYMVVKVGVEDSGTWGLGSSLEEGSHWKYMTRLSRRCLGKFWMVFLGTIRESTDRLRKGLICDGHDGLLGWSSIGDDVAASHEAKRDVGEYFQRHGLEDGQNELEWVSQDSFEGLYPIESRSWWTGLTSAMGEEWSSCASYDS